MMNLREAVARIEAAANQASREVRWLDRMLVGQVVRQGDVYLHRVEGDHDRFLDSTGRHVEVSRQLAPGTGSSARHTAEPPASVWAETRAGLPAWCDAETLLGPVVVSAERFTVSHPEHAHLSLPAGTYQVTFQRNPRPPEEEEWDGYAAGDGVD